MSFGSHVARIGDIGIGSCPCHQGAVGYMTIIVTGAPNARADELQIAQVGSVGVSSCGHSTIALTGASFVDADGLKVHRQGDSGANCGPYIIVTSSPTTDAL